MAPSFISQLMTNNGAGDKNALNTSGLPTLSSLGGASMMTMASTSSTTATSSRAIKTPVRGPAATPPMLPQLSPVMVGRPGPRPEALKFGLPLPLNLGASTASNPMGVPGGGMLGAGGIRPTFRRQTSQQGSGADGGANPAGAAPSSTAPATATGRSMAMAPSPWNNNQKIQDFFLHITDMEKAAHAEQKIIDIRELIARNTPSSGTSRPQGSPQQATPEQDEGAPSTGNNADFKNALSGLLAARQGGSGSGRTTPSLADNQEAEEPEKEESEDNNAGESEMTREEMRGALANMLNKRSAGAPSPVAKRTPPAQEEDPRQALMAMLKKRGGGASEEEEVAKKPASRADMLSEMLARRGAQAESSSSSSGGDGEKANPIAQMLAKRAQSAQSAGEETTPKNPIEQMLLRRGPPPSGADASEPASDSAEVALKDDPKYEQYFKMLRFGHPKEVVKHKMQRDGLDPWIMDCDPSKPLPPKPTESTPTSSEGSEDEDTEAEYQAQLKEYEEKHGKYLQMLKVGLPRTVVQHKMQMDGVDPNWLQGPPKRRVSSTQGPSEEEIAEHKKKYEKYFKMLRMGLPRGAVEHKMRMAGVDPKELDGPRRPTTSAGAPTAATPVKPKLARQESIRKKLHWETKKRRDSDIPRDSLWGLSSEMTMNEVKISTESKEMLEKLFVKDMSEANKKRDAAGAGVGGKGTSPATKKKPMIALIDMKKSQNIAITLARVKMGFPELKRELLCMNPSVLSTAQLQSLIDMWPDTKEQQAINKFSGDMSSLGSGEKFLWEVRNIPRCKEKLSCLIFKQEFPSRVQELKDSINLVIDGVHQVCSSAGLRQLFIYILQIGNLLNFGTDANNAVEGFSLGSLVKFSQTKAFVGGITFLQYVVQSIERDVPHLARFYDEIGLISKCSKVSFHSLTSEKNALEAGIQTILSEAEREVTLSAAAAAPELEMSSSILKKFAAECEHELGELEKLLRKAEDSKAHFLKYFEEEGTDDELDVLLSHIANFTAEYHREHLKYLEKMKREMKGLFKKFSPSTATKDGAGAKDKEGNNAKDSSDDKMQPVLRRRASRQSEEERVLHPQPHRVIHQPKPLQLDELSSQSDSEPDFDDASMDGSISMDDGSVPPSPCASASASAASTPTGRRPRIATRSA